MSSVGGKGVEMGFDVGLPALMEILATVQESVFGPRKVRKRELISPRDIDLDISAKNREGSFTDISPYSERLLNSYYASASSLDEKTSAG